MADKQAPEGVVIVRGAGDGFAQEIAAGSHHFRSDEPASVGGTNSGPTAYDLLLAALGSCSPIHSQTIASFHKDQTPFARSQVPLAWLFFPFTANSLRPPR